MNNNIKSLDLIGKNQIVLVRSDWNVPVDNGNIISNYRIKASLKTLNFLCHTKRSKIILLSHFGRPKKKFDPNFSFQSLIPQIRKEIHPLPLLFIQDVYSNTILEQIKDLPMGSVILLDNIRFYENETHTSSKERLKFAKYLASLGTAYVNDAFGVAHRKHASTYEITNFLPSYAGFLLEKEVQVLRELLQTKKRPFTSIIGGSKLSTKLNFIHSLLKISDYLIIGGGITYTFLKARGDEIGLSYYEPDFIETAQSILKDTEKHKKNLFLPIDHTITDILDKPNDIKYNVSLIPKNYMGVDIGKNTLLGYMHIIQKSQTILWNGPMGVFENPNFANGTKEMARSIANSKGTKIVGGGDSLSAIFQENLQNHFSHMSTGGGAMLSFIENLTLPALDALKNNTLFFIQ